MTKYLSSVNVERVYILGTYLLIVVKKNCSHVKEIILNFFLVTFIKLNITINESIINASRCC